MILLLLIFTYAEDIRFQVSADGTVNMVEMRNKPNTEHICMYAAASDAAPDFERSENQARAGLTISMRSHRRSVWQIRKT